MLESNGADKSSELVKVQSTLIVADRVHSPTEELPRKHVPGFNPLIQSWLFTENITAKPFCTHCLVTLN